MLFSAQPPTSTTRYALPDGSSLFTQHWIPETSPRGTVLIVHGYSEHSGRYGHVATALYNQGYAVYAYDQRGFGRSPGRRALVWSLQTLSYDLHVMATRLRRTTRAPLFVLGHSMGGLVTLSAALHPGLPVDGLVLSAPSLLVDTHISPLVAALADVFSRFLPMMPTVGAVENGISRDPQVIADAKADPLNYHGRVTARTGAEILRGGERVLEHASSITLPYLLLYGTNDTIVEPAGSTQFHERSGATDKMLRCYEGARHEVLNEPEHETVLADISAWLQDRTPTP